MLTLLVKQTVTTVRSHAVEIVCLTWRIYYEDVADKINVSLIISTELTRFKSNHNSKPSLLATESHTRRATGYNSQVTCASGDHTFRYQYRKNSIDLIRKNRNCVMTTRNTIPRFVLTIIDQVDANVSSNETVRVEVIYH